MGARTNFHFKQGDNYVTLYSHWGGDTQLLDLAVALKKATPRWGDIGYATRIVISTLIGNDWNSETGFGLYAGEIGGEESYHHVVIDMDNQIVIVDGHSHSFDSFIEYQMEVVENHISV
jgi:hypothetical protein